MAEANPIQTSSRFQKLTGRHFGLLSVTGYVGRDKHGHHSWRCECSCGQQHFATTSNLLCGRTGSCGCSRPGRRYDSAYNSWHGMIHRCTSITNKKYADYGGRGITVCDRWLHSFENFLADMGPRPSPKHSIDRRENHGNYEPGNCYWATQTEQTRNTRRNHLITLNGETLCLADWCLKTGINRGTLYSRLVTLKWPPERALASR